MEFTVKVAPKATPEELNASLSVILNEINKHKPLGEKANVSVQVQADQKK
jgi:hypothetical protein